MLDQHQPKTAPRQLSSQEFNFTILPLDMCPRCGAAIYTMPVAIAGDRAHTIVRYACPRCRLLYDVSYDLAGLAEAWGSYAVMPDRFVRYSEGIESRPRDGAEFPVGPVRLLAEART